MSHGQFVPEPAPREEQALVPQAAQAPIVRYLIRARAEDFKPRDVQVLYQEVGEDVEANAWLDLRFVDRVIPPGWRELENEIEELAYEAAAAGISFNRVGDELLQTDDPLGRLRCLIRVGRRREPAGTEPLPPDRLANLEDLIETSRRRIELFAVEEGFHFGLPPFETLQLYQDVEADPRAVQYLNRRFTEGAEPADLAALRSEAQALARAYDRLGYLPSAVLGELHPRTGDRSLRQILSQLVAQLESLGGTVSSQ